MFFSDNRASQNINIVFIFQKFIQFKFQRNLGLKIADELETKVTADLDNLENKIT